MEVYLLETLPELQQNNERVKFCLEYLESLGALTVKDLYYLEIDDLKGCFSVVQARKLLKARQTDSSSTEPNSSDLNTSTSSEGSSCSSDWISDFQVPWNKCSPQLLQALDKEQRPNPALVKELIHNIIDDVLKVTKKPGRKNLAFIAHKIVSTHRCLRDMVNDIPLGTGHTSLTNQLFYRWENVTRKKRKFVDGELPSSSKNAPYGCVNWCPPLVEKSSLESKKIWLQNEFQKSSRDLHEVLTVMSETYASQRNIINKNFGVQEVLEEWPFLSDPACLFQHYGTLVNQPDPAKKLPMDMRYSAMQIYKTMKLSKKTKVVKAISQLKTESQVLGSSTKAFGMISLLTADFNEDIFAIMRCYKEDTLPQLILEEIPANPVVIVFGSSPASGSNFKVAIENKFICSCEDFFIALSTAFCCYYIFNMVYPKSAMATLEFLQRYIAGINVQGSKSGKRMRGSVHPKVVSLGRKMNASKKQ